MSSCMRDEPSSATASASWRGNLARAWAHRPALSFSASAKPRSRHSPSQAPSSSAVTSSVASHVRRQPPHGKRVSELEVDEGTIVSGSDYQGKDERTENKGTQPPR